MPRRRDRAILVTSAATSRTDQINTRQRRYLITMAARTLLFVGAIVLFRGVWRYLAIGGSLVLPWLAVVVANAGLPPNSQAPDYVAPAELPAITGGRSSGAPDPASGAANGAAGPVVGLPPPGSRRNSP